MSSLHVTETNSPENKKGSDSEPNAFEDKFDGSYDLNVSEESNDSAIQTGLRIMHGFRKQRDLDSRYVQHIHDHKPEPSAPRTNLKKRFSSLPPVAFLCDDCGANFNRKANLKRHKNLVHCPDQPLLATYVCDGCQKRYKRRDSLKQHQMRNGCHQLIAVKGFDELTATCVCDECGVVFPNLLCLAKHKKQGHDGQQTPRAVFSCDQCSLSYSRKSHLAYHQAKKHDVRQQKVEKSMSCSVLNCDFRCALMSSLVKHLNAAHDENLTIETLTFTSQQKFEKWLAYVQRNVPCVFLRRGMFKKQCPAYMYYYCSRSGKSFVHGERKRRMKTHGSMKINRTCPAYFVLRSTGQGVITIRYQAKHFCHTDPMEQVEHLRLLPEDRNWIVNQFNKNVSLDVIQKEISDNREQGGTLRRIHVLTRENLRHVFSNWKTKRFKEFDSTGAGEVYDSCDDFLKSSDALKEFKIDKLCSYLDEGEPTTNVSDLERSRKEALDRLSEAELVIKTVKNAQQLRCINECLENMKAKVREIGLLCSATLPRALDSCAVKVMTKRSTNEQQLSFSRAKSRLVSGKEEKDSLRKRVIIVQPI